jgi:hypothetical protein
MGKNYFLSHGNLFNGLEEEWWSIHCRWLLQIFGHDEMSLWQDNTRGGRLCKLLATEEQVGIWHVNKLSIYTATGLFEWGPIFLKQFPDGNNPPACLLGDVNFFVTNYYSHVSCSSAIWTSEYFLRNENCGVIKWIAEHSFWQICSWHLIQIFSIWCSLPT